MAAANANIDAAEAELNQPENSAPEVAQVNEPIRDDAIASDEKRKWRATLEKVKNLPAPVGVLLIGAGIVVAPLPGPMGMPLIIAGGMVLAPKAFRRVEESFERNFPSAHKAGVVLVERFVSDMEKRYPTGGS
jgi:hypothetical protein